jgi:hypothetical protein
MRFSIRSILILTAVAALFSALLFGMPDFFAFLGMLAISWLTPTCLICAIVYGRGYTRAFAIGAIIPAAWILLWALYFLPMALLSGLDWQTAFASPLNGTGIIGLKIAFVFQWMLIAMSGGAAVAVRRLCVGSNRQPVAQSHVASHSSEPIEPLTKAELYRILEGRMQSPAAANGSGLTSKVADPAFDS